MVGSFGLVLVNESFKIGQIDLQLLDLSLKIPEEAIRLTAVVSPVGQVGVQLIIVCLCLNQGLVQPGIV